MLPNFYRQYIMFPKYTQNKIKNTKKEHHLNIQKLKLTKTERVGYYRVLTITFLFFFLSFFSLSICLDVPTSYERAHNTRLHH